jgi:exopolysaccharide production protein ExoQ
MGRLIATAAFLLLIAGLFVLNYDRRHRTSAALWLPVAWLLISGSRPVSVWLEMAPPASAELYLDGSPLDRNILTAILFLGVAVLLWRVTRVPKFLKVNVPILIFLLYCAISVTWSDYPFVAFKRWIKYFGDFVMVLIVMTDFNPSAAIKRVLARVGFLLLPLSVLVIKYFPDLGRAYGRWEGKQTFTGVASDKNMLGMACLVFGLGSAWCLFNEYRGGRRPEILVAHAMIVAMALWLLRTANSMTSLACFMVGASAIVIPSVWPVFRRRAFVNTLVAGILLLCISVLFLDVGSYLLGTMGRDSTLTGRTDLWQSLLSLTTNPWLGTGFESFWLGKRLQILWTIYWWHPNESHNGYLELFLNVGWIGIALFGVVVVTSYQRVIAMLRSNPEAATLRLAFLVVGLAYSLTEVGFRMTSSVWFFFLFAATAVPKREPQLLSAFNQRTPMRASSPSRARARDKQPSTKIPSEVDIASQRQFQSVHIQVGKSKP